MSISSRPGPAMTTNTFQTIQIFSVASANIPSSLPTIQPQAPDGQQSLGASTSLYLYTFLATLVLLLSVSSAIVLRSLIVRRRQRRLVEEAIRNGTWTPPTAFGGPGRKKDLGEKPSFFVASVSGGEGEKKRQEDRPNWGNVIPVAAAYLNAPSTTYTSNTSTSTSPTPAARTPLQRYLSFSLPRPPLSPSLSTAPQQQQPSQPPPQSSSPSSSLTQVAENADTTVQVTFLVAMPSLHLKLPQHRRLSQDSEHEREDELPHLEFGVAEVPVMESAPA